MAYSVHLYAGDAATTQYAVNFTLGYLDQSHVICTVEGEVDGLGDPIPRTLTWITANLVDIGVAPAQDLEIIIQRKTPKDLLFHDYSDGAVISESNLDESNLQNLMLAHEILDGYTESTRAFDLNMNGFNITELADPLLAQDAATKAYVDLISAQDQVDLATAQAVIATAAAVAAAAAELGAENALDAFTDIYLGAFTTANEPTLDNDGDALAVGALYWNTDDTAMYAYDGADWQTFMNPTTYVGKSGNTGSASMPAGTTAERDGTPVFGMQRANSTTTAMEWYNGSAWVPMGGGATGAPGIDEVFFENEIEVTEDYTITTDKNAVTAGPVAIATGKTVTVPTGSVWTVV